MWDTLRFLIQAQMQKRASRRSLPRILAVQQQRLRRLVAHAQAHSPYYQWRYRDIDPARFQLEELPILTKTEMMEHFDQFLTVRDLRLAELDDFMSNPARLGQWYKGRYAPSRTSGTQGLPAVIVQDRGMMDLLFALQMTRASSFQTNPLAALRLLFRPVRLAAITIGRGFYPSAVGLAYAPAASRRFMDRLWLTDIEPISHVGEHLNAYQPDVLLAYANVLEILAREALGGRLRLGQRSPLRQVVNMSEPLSDGARQLLQEAFSVPVTNNYATGECMALSVGCPQGHGMHLQADWAILEVVDHDNRPVPAGQPGEKVLITNLYNTIQPFIRYEVADVVTLSPDPCPCGSPLPLIRSVEGRTDEVVWVRDGDHYRQVHPYVFIDVLDHYPPVGWYQVIQCERNRFLLRASPAPHQRLAQEELGAVLRQGLDRFGLANRLSFDVEITNNLAPDPRSGKLKRITSRIGPPANGQSS